MYIRQISRKNKDGSSVTYVQLAHNERDPDKGFAVAKVLYNFGRLEELDLDQLKRLVKSITRFLEPSDVLDARATPELGRSDIQWKTCKSYGGVYLLTQLWNRFGFPQILSKPIRQASDRTPVLMAVFAMIANRCLSPSSKLAVSEWVKKQVHIPGLPQIDVQILYRAMDFLLVHQAELEKEIYWSVADILKLRPNYHSKDERIRCQIFLFMKTYLSDCIIVFYAHFYLPTTVEHGLKLFANFNSTSFGCILYSDSV
jgi:hypothetical protein